MATLTVIPHAEIIAECGSADDLLVKAKQLNPDYIIADYKMPGADMIDVSCQLKRVSPRLKIIALTGIQSSAILRKLFESIVDGLLLKDDHPDELITAINTIDKGYRYISTLVQPHIEGIQVKLTARELQLLNLIALGWSRSRISEQLGITTETIKSYRKNIMHKLDAHTSIELLNKAYDLNLIDRD